MKTCENCKYWHRDDMLNEEFGKCSNDIFVYGDSYKGKKVADGRLFEYWDYEGYNAGFQTRKNFGCIGFERKEPIS